MTYRHVLSILAIGLTLAVHLPYIRSILHGRTKPHVFSWVIWAITTLVVFFAQLADGGGAGAWAIGVSGLLTALIAGLAYARRGDVAITKTDAIFLGAALASLPIWYATADPVWAVMLLTVIDLLGFGPTFRSVIADPFREQPIFFFMFLIRNLFVIFALEHHSMTTVLFPAAISAACLALIVLIFWRRRMPGTARGGVV